MMFGLDTISRVMARHVLAVRDIHGELLQLGRELDLGGEGVFCDLPLQRDFVAKLHHEAPDAAKQSSCG